MKFYRCLLAGGLLAGAATTAHAQTTPPRPPLRAMLDTVAVTGTIRVLTLAAAPGPDIPVNSLRPGRKTAMLHQPPTGTHEYDLTGIRVLVSEKYNMSSTGILLVNLMLPDSITHAPSSRALLPAPIAVTDREVRRAKDGVLTLDVRALRITLPTTGVFVVAEGAPEPPYHYLGDTILPSVALASSGRLCTCDWRTRRHRSKSASLMRPTSSAFAIFEPPCSLKPGTTAPKKEPGCSGKHLTPVVRSASSATPGWSW